MLIIDKDITTVDYGIIAHQVNCKGGIGSGVAKALIDKWSKVKTQYHMFYDFHKDKFQLLGKYDLVNVEENVIVFNCFTQFDRGYDGKLYTSYSAIDTCFTNIGKLQTEYPIHIPYLYGCGLGGGDWETVKTIIDARCPNVIACRYSP